MIENINKVIRIADVIGGHIHPAACVTKSGTLFASYLAIPHGMPNKVGFDLPNRNCALLLIL